MEVEGAPKLNRVVSICLVAVAHDKVEERLTKANNGLDKKGELRFWELGDRGMNTQSRFRDFHMETIFMGNMTFLYSALIVFLLDIDDYRGHGEIKKRVLVEFQVKKRSGFDIYKRLTENAKLIFILIDHFYSKMCYYRDKISSDDVTEYFGQNQSLMNEFTEITIKLNEKLSWNECLLNMTNETMDSLYLFLANFYQLLIKRKDDLPIELQDASVLITEMKENFTSYRKYLNFAVVNANLRDSYNWRYIQEVVRNRAFVKKIILFVGASHIPNLRKLIMRHNMDQNQEIIYNEIVVIFPPYIPNIFDEKEPVGDLKIPEMTEEDVVHYTREMLKKLKYWRKLTNPYKPLKIEKENKKRKTYKSLISQMENLDF